MTNPLSLAPVWQPYAIFRLHVEKNMHFSRDIIDNSFSSLPYFDFSLKDKQLETIHHVMNGFSTICVLPTGYGKSICFVAPPLLYDQVSFLLLHRHITACIQGDKVQIYKFFIHSNWKILMQYINMHA